tara:strand:- start:227 stop:517 length:291 start_codon:yes stop_codon:yes gene_type:complete
MSRTKEMLDDEMESYLNSIDMDYADYYQWLETADYVNIVNEDADMALPMYSQYDIGQSLQYAKSCMLLEPSEIDRDIYFKLINEKIFEFLNKEYER